MPEYWERRKLLTGVLNYFARMGSSDRDQEADTALKLAAVQVVQASAGEKW